jgi:hypothetical protein
LRQWHVDPKIMCRQHLLGEHVEHHMFVGTINKGIDLEGYVGNGLIETNTLHSRHDQLVEEMKRRGYNHKSPLLSHRLEEIPLGKVNRVDSLRELLRRCDECRARYQDVMSTARTS